jgi:hypothetical protein
MADKLKETMLDALREAMAQPGEQRLFRSGKLAGLFPGRNGVSAEAAAAALRDGLLEMLRTENKGKSVVEWVRITPRGVGYLHEHESPVRALEDLRAALKTTEAGVPTWVAEMRQTLTVLGERLATDTERFQRKLDALSQRVEEALRRVEARGPDLPTGVKAEVPWALDALAYLDQRRGSGANTECALPELFTSIEEKHAGLSITAFHEGLRRLQAERALRLLPFTAQPSNLPQPEYALLDGGALLYYAAR